MTQVRNTDEHTSNITAKTYELDTKPDLLLQVRDINDIQFTPQSTEPSLI